MRATMALALAVAVAGCVGSLAAYGQPADGAGACDVRTLDIEGMAACRRALEPGRDARCAAAARTAVVLPVSGARTLEFGAQTRYGSSSKGLVVTADRETVVAPAGGHVLFAGDFRSYGMLVIIDACTFDVLVAGAEKLSTAQGAMVAQGQVIGTVAAPGSVVYLETRKAGVPVDPVRAHLD